MRWADRLEVRLHAHAAGPLSEGLHPWEEPTDDDRRRFPTDTQWKAERARRQTEGNKAARTRMERWVRECRGPAGAVLGPHRATAAITHVQRGRHLLLPLPNLLPAGSR